jgi:hypothetical protein
MAGQCVNVTALVPRGAGQAQQPNEDRRARFLSFRPCDDSVCALPSHDRLDHARWLVSRRAHETREHSSGSKPLSGRSGAQRQDQQLAYSVGSRSLADKSVVTPSRSLVAKSISRKIFRPPVEKLRESRERERKTVSFGGK